MAKKKTKKELAAEEVVTPVVETTVEETVVETPVEEIVVVQHIDTRTRQQKMYDAFKARFLKK